MQFNKSKTLSVQLRKLALILPFSENNRWSRNKDGPATALVQGLAGSGKSSALAWAAGVLWKESRRKKRRSLRTPVCDCNLLKNSLALAFWGVHVSLGRLKKCLVPYSVTFENIMHTTLYAVSNTP